MGTPTWSCYLGTASRDQAIVIAREIGGTVRDPARLASIIALAHDQSPVAEATAWRPYSLSGDAGLVLAFGYLDSCFPQEGWDHAAHRHLEAAARSVEKLAPAPLGLFAGLSGLGLGAAYAARGGPRYRRLIQRIDEVVAQGASALADRIQSRADLDISEFDLVSGLTGMAAYLLCRRGQPQAEAALRRAVTALVALSAYTEGPPAWHTSRALVQANDRTRKTEFPDGYVDCGLAHGIPGPLMLLSLAYAGGVDVAGLREGVVNLADWLLSHRHDDEWGINWPPAIPLALDRAGRPEAIAASTSVGRATARAGWCYGAPGIARALLEAGTSLDEPRLTEAAIDAMRATLRRPLAERRIDSPTFCHGVAGYLQCTLRFAHHTGLPEFAQAVCALTDQLIAMHEPDLPLGYRSLEMYGVHVDQPGLVDGATGVMTTLLAAAVEVEPTWDRAFLLS